MTLHKSKKTNKYKNESKLLVFLYNTAVGRTILKGLTGPLVSRIGGAYMDSRVSRIHIMNFVKSNNIDMSDYLIENWPNFNEFFTRKLKPGKRTVDMNPDVLASPCDGRMSAYRINEDSLFAIKNSYYSVERLIGSKELAQKFNGGTALVLRLCVDDYHRYGYACDGEIKSQKYMPGRLHTVRPIALEKYPVFVENTRECTIINTDNFGLMAQIEVGALMIGKIENYKSAGRVRKGEEKGRFLYGGSTIVLLLQKDQVEIDDMLYELSAKGAEERIRFGQKLGSEVGK